MKRYHMLDINNVRTYIKKYRVRRQSNKVLHGHPSPVFWLDREVSVPEVMRQHSNSENTIKKCINLYVGTPYCLPTNPGRCGFCLFPTEIYKNSEQLSTYLDYLKREGDLFRPYLEGAELSSIYFGGGTANLYKADQYAELMGIVRGVFDVPSHIEVTLEGIPQTFNHEKLAAMKDCGINRISMGVQQLDDQLIKASGRKQTAKQVFSALDSCRTLGLSVSVDLIFGWPDQTIDHMLKDLRAIVDTGISHITHYELNVAGRTDFSRNRRSELPSTLENLEMYRIGKSFLEENGFKQITPYDFEKRTATQSSSYLYEEFFRRPFVDDGSTKLGFDAWGWGYAGTSFFFGTPQEPGWAYMNQVRIDDYYRDINAGRFPIMRGFHYTEADLRLHLLFQELQGLSVDRKAKIALFGRDVVDDYLAVWQALEELSWVSINDDDIQILGDGVFYIPLIQNLLAHDRNEAIRKKRSSAETSAISLAKPTTNQIEPTNSLI